MRLDGKAGVVTGTSRGLGREILLLRRLRERASSLSRGVRRPAGGRRRGDPAGGDAVFQQGDVTREEDIVPAIERCRAEFGAFDLIVNNAGILGEGRLHETTNEQWHELVAIHLTGTFWGCKHAIDAMRAGAAARSSTSARSSPSRATATSPPTRR